MNTESVSKRVDELLSNMGLDEKIGQMCQLNGAHGTIPDHLGDALRAGRVGSILNEVDINIVNEMQRICVDESRLGIPLLIGRDVIHGFKTIFPIPLGQAASWDPDMVEAGARVSAAEAAATGVNWTFAPMIDITRDPRWGRIAESLGEDPVLCSQLGAAMVRGFQSDDLSAPGSIAACAKHFAGYGAAEAGRDYNTANIPENELRNLYLRPFHAAVDAGVATFMSAFCDLNGIPATGNTWLMNQILRKEWGYQGVVVSDWESVVEMTVHGFTHDDEEAAYRAILANVDMEMASSSYLNNVEAFVEQNKVSLEHIDTMVRRILTLKFRLGLFEEPYTVPEKHCELLADEHLSIAKEAALKSCVLLKNSDNTLPLNKSNLDSIAIIGPLADDGYEQLGTWIFDGESQHSLTCLTAIEKLVGDDVEVRHVKALATTRAASEDDFEEAFNAASNSDATILVLGEEAFMSGEAHSRADINLPGHQAALIEAVAKAGKPVVLVIMAGRPLTIEPILDNVDAVLFAWHPGTMGGPAIADLLFGIDSPSGKLPVTFPRKVGQVPIYYAHKNTGRPATDETCINMDDVVPRAPQTSLGMTSFHLDTGYKPLFPFGFGLSYGEFRYVKITTSQRCISIGDQIEISADVVNIGGQTAVEVVQLYVRDLVGSVTRPVKELKSFKRIALTPGERQRVTFVLHSDDLSFYNNEMQKVVEPGHFYAWIGGSSDAELRSEFEIIE